MAILRRSARRSRALATTAPTALPGAELPVPRAELPAHGAALPVIGGALAALALGGCAWVSGGEPEASGPAFPHAIHVEGEGLACEDCHGAADEEPMMMPLMGCLLCHEDMDEEKPPERRAAAFFVDEAPRPGVLELSDEIRFVHADHVALAAEDCTICHGDVGLSQRVDRELAFTMAECTTCHEALSAGTDCATCHTVIDRDWAPPTHALNWERLHGEAFRARGEAVVADCAMCHTESSCVQCHESEPPSSHDEFFRLRGHALHASLDRESCAVCHREDSCIRCHETVEPLSHSMPSFGSPRNTHCLGCHFPLRGEGCATCHQGAPSHQLAAPQPADHVPGSNCRLCHGGLAPLPHVDDGSACQACHR